MLDDLLEAFGKKHKKHKKAKHPYGKPKGKYAWYGDGYGPASRHGPAWGRAPRGNSAIDKGLRMLIDKVAARAGYRPDRPDRRYHHDDDHRGYAPPYRHGAPYSKRRRRDWDDD